MKERFYKENGDLVVDKECLKCKNVKPFSEFNKSSSGKYKLHNFCRCCIKEYNDKLYLDNKDNRINEVRIWNNRNNDKTRKYQENYRDKVNPDRNKRQKKIEIPDLIIPDF